MPKANLSLLFISSMCVVGFAMTIADTYRAMSSDIRQAAGTADHEDVRRAYLVLAELWSRAAARADGFTASVDESILEAIK
jgi:hypothetical protein